MQATEFLELFSIPNSITIVSPDGLVSPIDKNKINISLVLEDKRELFFSPAQHNKATSTKNTIVGTGWVWVDVDSSKPHNTILPPTIEIKSGNGKHLYWKLDNPIIGENCVETIESVNKALIYLTQEADKACFNANRWLRVPGSYNLKYDDKPQVVVEKYNPENIYNIADILSLGKLTTKEIHKIRTGDERGYESRSERDFAVIKALLRLGIKESFIEFLFSKHKIGNKVRDVDTSPTYLSHSITKAKESIQTNTNKQVEQGIVVQPDGYYIITKSGLVRASTFIIIPEIHLSGSEYEASDALIATVKTVDKVWHNVHFPREAFNSVRAMDSYCKSSHWQILAGDSFIRSLLPMLMEELARNNGTVVSAAPTIGLYFIDGIPYYVGDSHTLSATNVWTKYDGPIAWLPTGVEHPKLDLLTDMDFDKRIEIGKLLPTLNQPFVTWPFIGWMFASLWKPFLENSPNKYRLPILNVTGTKGSGKTTLLLRVFKPLLGNTEPKSYDANTTRFVKLALLGSTNSMPITFSEFRYSSAVNFLQTILLAYDTGHDPRGTPGLKTVDFPLSAPFTVDGEDTISDAAARERIIPILMKAAYINEKTSAYKSFKQFNKLDLRGFAKGYIQFVMPMLLDGSALALLEKAENDMFSTFTMVLPDRIRRNFTVVLWGIYLFCKYVECEPPSPSVLSKSISGVFNISSGRSKLLGDEFIEDLINATNSNNNNSFKWNYDSKEGIVYFQLATAYQWWAGTKKRNNTSVLEKDAIRSQLDELGYITEIKVRHGMAMYGVVLEQARQFGLDIPETLSVSIYTENLR